MDLPSHKRNLIAFVNSLPSTEIRFMYINASTNTVDIKTQFHVYQINKRKYYVIFSNCNDGVYVFKESKVKYLLESFSIKNGDPIILSDIKFQDKVYRRNAILGDKYDVNHGDHMTFTLIGTKTPPRTVVKAHFTHYDHMVNDFTFSRFFEECNFTLPESLDNFGKIHCENKKGIAIRKKTIETEFPAKTKREIVKDLCVQMQKSDHKIRSMAGGTRKVYKTIDFMSEQLSRFIIDTLFGKCFPHFEFIMLYDEGNWISDDHIVVLASDDEGNRSVIYIDPYRCMKACFAHNNKATANKLEKTCLGRWITCANSIIHHRKINM